MVLIFSSNPPFIRYCFENDTPFISLPRIISIAFFASLPSGSLTPGFGDTSTTIPFSGTSKIGVSILALSATGSERSFFTLSSSSFVRLSLIL